MFENLKDNEKLLLNAVNGMSPSFENATVRMLLATISELRARNIAIQEVKDECDGGVVLDEMDRIVQTPNNKKRFYLTTSAKERIDILANNWISRRQGLYLQCAYNEKFLHIDVVNKK